MDDLVQKIGHKLPEVSDRAVKTIHSKLTCRLSTIDEFLSVENGMMCGLLLHWINNRQSDVEIPILLSGLQLVKAAAETPVGHKALIHFGAIEFLNAYHKNTTATAEAIVGEALNNLVSPGFIPMVEPSYPKLESQPSNEINESRFEPSVSTKEIKTKTASQSRVYIPTYNDDKIMCISDQCEYPAVFLVDGDEKRLFDLGVQLKFGSVDEVYDGCEIFEERILKDFPTEVLLQRTDCVKSLVSLLKVTEDPNSLIICRRATRALTKLLERLDTLPDRLSNPQFNPSSGTLGKPLEEFINLSYPSMKIEEFKHGTPGNTMSTMACVELILLNSQLKEPEVLGDTIELWRAARFAFSKLLEHHTLITKLFSAFSGALEFLRENSEQQYVESLVDLIIETILLIPIEDVTKFIDTEGTLIKSVAEVALFRDGLGDRLLPYLETLDSGALDDYNYAQSCRMALDSSRKMSHMLTQNLPITSINLYNNALDFFENLIPSLEFDSNIDISRPVLDLNCYAIIVNSDMSVDAKMSKAQDLLLSLMASPIPRISTSIQNEMLRGMTDGSELAGIGEGVRRGPLVQQVCNAPRIFTHLVTFPEFCGVIPCLIENMDPDKLTDLLPFITLIQANVGRNPELLKSLHLLTTRITNQPQEALKLMRDLFSSDKTSRIMAGRMLYGVSKIEQIFAREHSEEIFDAVDLIETLEAPDSSLEPQSSFQFSDQDLQNLFKILNSATIETTLKTSALEQILAVLLSGLIETRHLDQIIQLTIPLLSPLAKTAGLAEIKLTSVALQVLIVIAQNFTAYASKISDLNLKFVVRLIGYLYHKGDLKWYAAQLLYIFLFSNEIQRNNFLRNSEDLILVPESKRCSAHVKPINVMKTVAEGFLAPFNVTIMTPRYEPSGFVKAWMHYPSSDRVLQFITNPTLPKVNIEAVLGEIGDKIQVAERHTDIMSAVDRWVNVIKCTEWAREQMINASSRFFKTLLTILRTPPASHSEDVLHSYLLHQIAQVFPLILPSVSSVPGYFEFASAISEVLQRNLLPFLLELTETRVKIAKGIICLLISLLPFHEVSNSTANIRVLNRFHLDSSSQACILNLIHKFIQNQDETILVDYLVQTLVFLMGSQPLSLALDIRTSASSQRIVESILESWVTRTLPCHSSQSFELKGSLKLAYMAMYAGAEFYNADSFVWAIRLAEDRDAVVRMLSWGFLQRKLPSILAQHPTLIDIACSTLFYNNECYGVQSQALAFLAAITGQLVNSEEDPEVTLRIIYQQGVISQLKNMLYQNSGTPPQFFAVIGELLYNLVVLDQNHVLPVCSQLDIWDGLTRLLKPGALDERMRNGKRENCPFEGEGFESEVIALVFILNFLSCAIRKDAQVCDYIVESTHIAEFCTQWVDKLTESWDQGIQKTINACYTSLFHCLHCLLYTSKDKAARNMGDSFNYYLISDALDLTSSFEVRMAAVQMLSTCLTHVSADESMENIILHVIRTFKECQDSGQLSEGRDTITCLSCILSKSDLAKEIALRTGFAYDLTIRGEYLISELQNMDLARKQKTPIYEATVREMKEILHVFKHWASSNEQIKTELLLKEGKLSCVSKFIFALWPVALRNESLFVEYAQCLSTMAASAPEAKKSFAMLHNTKSSLLTNVVEVVSKNTNISEVSFGWCLTLLGCFSNAKETRQCMVKSKFARGVAERVVRNWLEVKDGPPNPKLRPLLWFLASFTFSKQGQDSIINVRGMLEMLLEVLDKYCRNLVPYAILYQAFLLLRNLCFHPSNKAHIIANPKSLPMMLAFISSPNQQDSLRHLAVDSLWALLYNNQKIKGMIVRLKPELERVLHEVDRQIDLNTRTAGVSADLEKTSEGLNCILKICAGS